MADEGGGDIKNGDGGGKSANVKSEHVSTVVRKPSRRSPTTGHRRKKTDLKRSQSSPREVIVPTSSDDEAQRAVPVRRKSLSPGPGPEPKKVLRRRHRIKEKSQEPKNESRNLDGESVKEAKLKDRSKSLTNEAENGRTAQEKTAKVVHDHSTNVENKKTNGSTKKNQSITEASKIEDKSENDESKISEPSKNGVENKDKCETKSSSWLGGWSPFKRKEPKAETSLDVKTTGQELELSKADDYYLSTTDDEIAAEFVKIVSQANKGMKPVETKKVDPAKSEGENAPLLREKEVVKSWSQLIRESRTEFVKFMRQFPNEVQTLKKLRNRCFCDLLIMFIVCGCGAFVFKTTEGTFESVYKCGVKRVKRDFIDDLWRSSHFMKEDEWKSKARRKLWEFENQLHEAFEAGMTSYSGQKSWTFINGIIYCLTVITTIGYGHIAPVTNSGRALTIAYSIIGIPLFLILLADFGKLFTRGIKFLWAFVRRVYYTGSCRKVRRTGPVQEVMKGVQLMYDSIRRPSMFPQGADGPQMPGDTIGTPGDAPSTPALSVFAIDDEFNLPISVAISILLVYIFMGATVFWFWEEDWSFFESFYFVFISMSTIGFGDLVPKNQMYMMASIVYLAFGLALTSMCINVVQEKLSDSFRKASAKIGATIGLRVCEDDGTISPVSPTHVELAEVHKPSVHSALSPSQKIS